MGMIGAYMRVSVEELTHVLRASQHVLEHAGFTREGEVRQIEWEGQLLSFCKYMCLIDR